MTMGYRWIEDIGKFRDISGEWDKAVIESGDYNPFLLSDFIITWWKYFGEGKRLKIFVVYDSDRISGGIPLYLERKGVAPLNARILYYVGGSVANYTEPLYAGTKSGALLLLKEAILKGNDIDAVSLPNVRAENPIISEYKSGAVDRRFVSFSAQDHFNMMIDLSAGKEKYLAGLPRKLKKDLRQKRKHAVKDYGAIKLRRISGREDIKKFFGLYADFSVNAFKERGRKNMLEDARCRSFFEEFLLAMDEKGRSDAFALLAGDKVLAVIFGYRFGKGFNWALTAFNYEFKYVRPGYLLVEELIGEIIGRGDTFCNCYGHESFYKNQWCNRQMPMCRLFLAKPSLKGVSYILIQRFIASLRTNKVIYSAARKLKDA